MDLPLVLAGPIVRRVDDRSASFWIALREPADVTGRVWVGQQTAPVPASSTLKAEATTPTTRLGEKLHLAMVTVKIPTNQATFSPRELHSYDLAFAPRDGASFAATELAGAGLLADELPTPADRPGRLALGYATDRLPSFITPAATPDALRLAQASCRKPHGPDFDAMAWLDDHIADELTDVDERPQMLFLTGDQIYADDVPGCLLPVISILGHELMGADEDVALSSAANPVPGTLANFPAERREALVRSEGGLTSTSSGSHLITFGEFAATYLLAWNPAIWSEMFDADHVLRPLSPDTAAAVQPLLSDLEACAADEDKTVLEHFGPGFTARMKNVERYRDAVPKVARALANCITYTGADDHEVTDDWNLNKAWQNGVFTKPLGRQIIRNGVMAYTFFQAWGNAPATFGTGKSKELVDEAVKTFAAGPKLPHTGANLAKIEQLVGLTASPSNQATFSWRVDLPMSVPTCRIIGLDTRTRRKFKGQGIAPPALLGDSLNSQIPTPPTGFDGVLIVLSPVPVFSPFLFDAIGQPTLAAIADFKTIAARKAEDDPCSFGERINGAEEADAEGWTANLAHFEAFLARIAPYKRVVILSGDVHHGAGLEMDYWRKGVTEPSRIIQLTASAAHNSFNGTVASLQRSAAQVQQLTRGPALEVLGWKGKSSIVVPDDAQIPPATRARLNRSPAAVANRPWPAGTTIPDDKPPDWRWRLKLLRDSRPNDSLPIALRPAPLGGADVNPASPLAGLQRVAARHQASARINFAHLRQLVFTPNVGLINFANGSDVSVMHTLLSKKGPMLNEGAPNTQHAATLAPSGDPAPQLEAGI